MSDVRNGLIVCGDGTRMWYKNDKLHRTDGPAIEEADGTRRWCVNGKLHRTDGPAEMWVNGTNHWCVNNKCYTSNKSFQKAAGLTDAEMAEIVTKYGDIS